jgi:hypothetical protein
MIEMHFPTKPPSMVCYCPVTNEYLHVHIGGRTLIDTERGIVRKDWLEQLINFVLFNGYNVESRSGTPAFVRGLASQGHLSIKK